LSRADEFKKEWLVTLASTNGILITISLAILTLLYTTLLIRWQLILIGLLVAGSSFSLMLSTIWVLDALGALIIAVSTEERNEEKIRKRHEWVRVVAKRAYLTFKLGIILIFIAIVLYIILLFLFW